jgi:small-conductance mechanosensitive channel
MDILKDMAQRLGLVLDDPAPDVFFENYGDSSIDFHLAIWVDDPSHRKRVPSDLRLMIWKEFEKRGIEIPFSQQDLHIRSGNPAEIPGEVLS